MSALDSVIEQGDGRGARLLIVGIYLHSDANNLRRPEKMSEALGLPARGAKLRVSEPEKLGSQTDALDVWVHTRSVANDS